MPASRLDHITKIGVEDMGDLADSLDDSEVLRLENLDTDLRPPASAIETTRAAVDDDAANSYLPFLGLDVTRKAATARVSRSSGVEYDWRTQSVISAGGLSGILNVLLATLNPGDEVLMTDPIYVGLVNRVRLAGGVPKYVPLRASADGWRLDLDALREIDPSSIKMVLLMSPSMPTGAVLNDDEWAAVVDFVERSDAWILYNAAMERILFDGRKPIHPASFGSIAERVITVGSASKEYRMIGWRVGWVVGPAELVADVARVSISNVVCQTGIAMGAVARAIEDVDDGIARSVSVWEERRDLLLEELSPLEEISGTSSRPVVVPPHGGWSLLLDVDALGYAPADASKRLLSRGKIAATPMLHWGTDRSNRYVRFVFSNEPVERLHGVGDRVLRALES